MATKKGDNRKPTKKPAPKARAVTSRPSGVDPLPRLRKICLALPEATEFVNHSHPCFMIGKKTFVMYLVNHHGDGRMAIWCKAPPGAQHDIVSSDPERFFVPPYVGPRGWIGIHLNRGLEWDTVAALVRESYLLMAPKKLVARLTGV